MELIISLAIVLSAYIFTVIFKFIVNRYKSLQTLKKYGIPGPEPDFLIGNLHQLRKHGNPNDVVSKWLKKYGNILGYYVGGVPYIVVNDIEMLKQMMIKDFHNFENRPPMVVAYNPIDKSLIAQEGQRWKEVRTLLTPTFSSGKIKLMTNVVTKKVDITVNEVKKRADKNEMFDIYELLQGLTLDVIADCAFAMKTHCQENSKDQFLVAVQNFFRYSHNRAAEYAVMFPFIASAMGKVIKYMTAGKMTTIIVRNVMIAIRARQQNPNVKSMDILQLMLDHKDEGLGENKKMTDEEIVGNAYVFLLAGFETTATALGFTFYLLITHPEIQERLYQEINAAEDFSYTTIQNLPYLEQVYNESLRIYPPLTGFITRACSEDYPIGEYTFPKGSQIVAPVWNIHHDPDLWPDPWKFDPDRFSPENKSFVNSNAFLPFGIGRRNCIGARFAQLEAKLALCKLLKNFRFEACEKTEHPLKLICPTVIINPANGVWLKAVPRNKE